MDETKLDQWLDGATEETNVVGAEPVLGLFDAWRRLRALGVPWDKLIALIGPVITILTGPGTFAEKIQKLLELFFPPQPAPGAVAAARAP